MNAPIPLLEVQDLCTEFITSRHTSVRAVDGVSFTLNRGETVGLVGESGCGKSVTALSIMRLLSSPPGRIAGGKVLLEGRDLLTLQEKEMRKVRGNRVAMVFQEPMTSLNPVFTIGNQINEALRLHRGMKRREAAAESLRLLVRVGISAAEERYHAYPHQLSGGMRQRAMIAMALCCNPDIIIADEPTTALDVTIQAQILDLISRIQKESELALLLITHDLGIIAESAHRVIIMYAGKVMEEAPTALLFDSPAHPYTRGLLNSVPGVDWDRRERSLKAIPGAVPDLAELPKGCRFADRCERKIERCAGEEPALEERGGRLIRCHRPCS